MNDSQHFERNLAIFGRFCPSYVDLIRQAKVDHLEFCKTSQDECNLRNRVGSEDHYYHSTDGALTEARQWFQEQTFIEKAEVLFVFGIGLGHYYFVAKEWLSEDKTRFLVFFEDDFAVLHRFFETEQATEIVSHPQIIIVAFQSPSEEDDEFHSQDFKEIVHAFVSTKNVFSQLKYYHNQRSCILRRLFVYLHLRLGGCRWFLQFFDEDILKSYLKNFYHNIFYLPQAHLGLSLFGHFEKIPAIICGAGPSLKKHFSALNRLKDRALIFGAGTAMNALNRCGVFPHFGVGIDPHKTSKSRIMTNFAYEIPYFYKHRFNYEALELIHGPKLFFRGNDDYGVESWFERQLHLDTYKPLNIGISTTYACLALALELGCDPIIFVGLDLAYTNKKRYTNEVVAHPLDREREKRFIFDLPSDKLVPIQSVDGEEIMTRVDWLQESTLYAKAAKKHPEKTIINATEGGMLIPSVPSLTLQEVTEKYLTRTFDLHNWIHEEIQKSEFVNTTVEDILEIVEQWQSSIQECMKIVDKMIGELSDLAQDAEETQNTPDIIKSETFLQYQETLEEQIFYKHFLKTWNVSYELFTLRDNHILKYHPELLSPLEKYKKEFASEFCRLIYIKDVAQIHLREIERIGDRGDILTFGKPNVKMSPLSPAAQGDGDQTYYYENGKIKTQMCFRKGKLDGEVKLFFPNGQLKRSIHFANGKLHGKEQMWDEAGLLVLESQYKHNQPVGVSRSWHNNGQLKKEVTFYDTPDHCDIVRWDKDGHLLEKKLYMPEEIEEGVIKKSEETRKVISSLTNKLEKLRRTKKT